VGNNSNYSLLRHSAAPAIAGLVLLLGLAACSGDEAAPEVRGASAAVPCIDEDPGKAATYADDDVAIARDPRQPDGAELESHRSGRRLPWFAKTALFVRGNEQVVVRVPSELIDAVKIAGWTQPPSSRTAEAVLVQSTSDCSEDWTAYPGGLVFRGRHCVRLIVEGPGDARGSLLVGLRRDCSGQAKR
jgi:hypothetical protein